VSTLEGDEAIGCGILRRALEEPLRQIVNNSGFEGAVVMEKVRQSSELNFGFNAETEKYEDLVIAGVIDPTKVTRTALLLTTEALVSEIKEEQKTPAMPQGGGMGDMY
jgi:chaperonin GroEL